MKLAQEKAVHAAMDRLYMAVTDESVWSDALACVGRAFDSSRVAILRMTPRFDGLIEMRALNHDADVQRQYNEYYWALDPSHLITRDARVGEWLDVPELYDPGTTPQPEYIDFAIKNGIRFVVGGKVHADASSITVLGVQRPADHRPFGKECASAFHELHTHVGRAAALAAELRTAQINGALSLAALDRLENPVFAVNGRGKLLMANAAGEKILRDGSPFSILHGRLRACDADSHARLNGAITKCLELRGSAFSVPAPTDSWLVRVVPLPEFSGAALVYAAPAEIAPVAAETLAQLLGFTPAESAVAYMLADGWSPKEIAHARQVSLNTVRTQVRDILRKAGVRRQTDLAKILFAIPRVRTQP